jgi:hypothetical protein
VKLAHFLEGPIEGGDPIRHVENGLDTSIAIELVVAESLVRAARDGAAEVLGFHERVA